MREKAPLDAQISRVADRQHGHVTRQQLLVLGLSPRAIAGRVDAGRLIAVHAGVYAVGHIPRGALHSACAAVLACGDGAALSHESALALWGLGRWPRIPHVTAPAERRRPGIISHRSQTLGTDVWTRHGIRTTNPVRTIIDVAATRTDRQLIRLVNEARLSPHLSKTNLRRLLTRSRRIAHLIDPDQNPTRSQLEDDFVAWIKKHRLPMPRMDVKLHGHEVDALYPDHKLIIELDGWPYHSGRDAFHRDHRRDADHRAHGHDTIRYTGEQLTDDEAEALRSRLSRS